MRKVIQLLGVVMVLSGVSGAIDHVAVQPFIGVLNLFNRLVAERVELFEGYEVFTNLSLAVLGAVLIAAARLTDPS
ncbi:hypothetical protein ACFOWE_22915 [Planomonospora corallina]|uniref:Uncharacterized protein n=1 Tax=Planomonospora corallina TaxID=1806052 RepID=A0ABV8IAX0_9ACTN